MATQVLQFVPFQSVVDVQFWLSLAEKKLDILKLSQDTQHLTGYFTHTVSQPIMSLPGMALDEPEIPQMAVPCRGWLINTNTIEEFRALDKSELFNKASNDIWKAIQSGEILNNLDLLSAFFLLAYADLKKNKFYHWFAFPALMPEKPWSWQLTRRERVTDIWSENEIVALDTAFQALHTGYFLVKRKPGHVKIYPLSEWHDAFEDQETPVVGFLDPAAADLPGWPLRNLLALINVRFGARRVHVLCYRPSLKKSDANQSIWLETELPPDASYTGKAVGWERSEKNKLGPKLADLGPILDPRRLADTSVDLNLRLMRWRTMPQLDIDKMHGTKCLLLGAGTLGCYVARCLMGWGVRHITFVDNGRVSYSNPVRQPLYTFEDCLHGGKPKVEAAKNALEQILPSMSVEGVHLSIPMPGHDESRDTAEKSLSTLTALVSSHDVIFLLTDSRESRWLPTVLGALHHKIVINAALGFDTYVVMRHGIAPSKLGCYFCNDIVAPTDSLKDRTLDQQCTVTRPGLAPIAAALAVELMINVLQHPKGVQAPAYCDNSPHDVVPHQIRGFLGQFNQLLIQGEAYDKCTACSQKVLDTFQENPLEFLLKVLQDPLHLETVTGLDQLKLATDVLLEGDWTSEGDDDLN